MFFELMPKLNAVSYCDLIAKKRKRKKKKKRFKEIISSVWICPDLNADLEKKITVVISRKRELEQKCDH